MLRIRYSFFLRVLALGKDPWPLPSPGGRLLVDPLWRATEVKACFRLTDEVFDIMDPLLLLVLCLLPPIRELREPTLKLLPSESPGLLPWLSLLLFLMFCLLSEPRLMRRAPV